MMASEVRLCLIGAGRAGKVHGDSIVGHIPGATLAAVVDPDIKALDETAKNLGTSACFSSLEAALESIDFDAVVITTPTFTHKSVSVAAAKAGKHIFLEKPMALNLAECDEIIQVAQDHRVLLQLGFMRRFQPEFEHAAKRIQAGEIGQPMMVKSLTHGPGLPPAWARSLRTSNGLLAEVNSHDWDCVRWLMGANPERVYVEVANFKGPANGIDTEDYYDNALVIIRFENGGLGTISGVCPCEYGYDARVEIIGEKGLMLIGDLKGEAISTCVNRETGSATHTYRTWGERFAEGYIREMRHFIDSIRTGNPPKVSGEDGRWAVAGVLAGTMSFLERRPVHLSEIRAGHEISGSPEGKR